MTPRMTPRMTPERLLQFKKWVHSRRHEPDYKEWKELLAEIDALTEALAAKDKALDQAIPIVRKYVERNPKFYSHSQKCEQDPMGAHAWLEAAELRKREGQ